MERYYSLNTYLKEKYGEKVYKLALDAGLGCPNRDGTCGSGGCIFCSEGGSGDFAKKTIAEAKAFLKNEESQGQNRCSKSVGKKFIAYFQSFSNTYASADRLREIYRPAIEDENIVGLAIATRPDCLPADVLDLLSETAEKKPLWVELGLQTVHEKTALWFHRGYALPVFEKAMGELKKRNIDAVAHLIMNLPGESKEDMLQSVSYLNEAGIWGIKMHLLTILKGTRLGDMYIAGMDPGFYSPMTLEEYSDLICTAIGILDSGIVVHRITGDAPRKLLLAPMWTADKKTVLNRIHHDLADRNITQGCLQKCLPNPKPLHLSPGDK